MYFFFHLPLDLQTYQHFIKTFTGLCMRSIFLSFSVIIVVLFLNYSYDHKISCEILSIFLLWKSLYLRSVVPYFAVYNVHPHFCVHCTQGYYTHYYIHGMQSLYACIMCILIFPSIIWAKSVHYTWKNMVFLPTCFQT